MTQFTDPLEWLFGLEQFGIKLGLDNITLLLDALGHPERAFTSVHVAGTNGKGSVTAMVDAALRAAGHRSARYTSPHLITLYERFVIDGKRIEAAALSAVVGDLRAVVDRLRRDGALDVQPTFFEVTTAVAFELFRRAGAEVAVCEVGLGGRLDATNVLRPEVTAITSIGLDHQQYLGTTLRDIALEKAGIIKTGVPVVVGRMDPPARAAIVECARARGAEVVDAWAGAAGIDIARLPGGIHLRTDAHDYGDVTLALHGDHQIDNAAVAVRLLELAGARGLNVPEAAIRRGLQEVVWPARLDLRRLPDGREALLDAAHNPDGAKALAAFLASKFTMKCPLVFGAMRDKDAADMLRVLAPVVSDVICTRASNARSADPEVLAAVARRIAPGLAVAVHPVLRDALAAAWQQSPRIVVAGSIFLLGDVMSEFGWT
jgi:dihydrofolate synthase / folylpolyglutamate synthase